MVFVLHGVVLERFTECGQIEMLHKIIRILCNCAVPTFFFLSAVLLYRSIGKRTYSQLLTAKIQSLLIPYLCWSGLVFLARNKTDIFDMDFSIILKDILFSQSNSVLWYVRVMLEFIVLMPIFRYLLQWKKVFCGLTLIIFLVNLYMGPTNGYGTMRYWLPVYMLGAYIGSYHKKFIFDNTDANAKKKLCAGGGKNSIVGCCSLLQYIYIVYI